MNVDKTKDGPLRCFSARYNLSWFPIISAQTIYKIGTVVSTCLSQKEHLKEETILS